MMLDWLFPPPSERRLLPETRGRPMPYVLAIMTFVTLVVAAAGLAIANSAATLREGVANRYSIQIPDGSALAPRASAAARRAPGVLAVRAVPEEQVRKTLESWLGPGAAEAGLPLPALIDLDVGPDADLPAIERRILAAVPQARLLAYQDQLAPLARSLTALQWLALGLVGLMGAATAASVVLAARGALDTNRSTIEIMHGIGATDEHVARLFQRRIALDALAGATAGAAAAALVLMLVAGTSDGLAGELAGGALLRPSDLALLALLPIAASGLATAVARAAILKALRTAL